MSSFRRGAIVIACACSLLACDKKREATAAAAPSGMPPLDQPATAKTPADRPVHEPAVAAPNGDKLPPGHPALGAEATAGAPRAGAAPFAGATPGAAFDPKTVLAGVIKLDAKLKGKVADGDVIFVVARKYEAGSEAPGTPLAVRKMTAGKFPLPFALDSRDAMLVGTSLAGPVVITVRVDKDGDAMSKNPGDVVGVSKPVSPPQKNVVIALDKVL